MARLFPLGIILDGAIRPLTPPGAFCYPRPHRRTAMPPSADPAMELSSARHGETVVLSPRGRVDHASAEEFKTALAPHLARCARARDHVVLDLAGVDYISSAGLRVLMLAAKQAKAQGGTSPSPPCSRSCRRSSRSASSPWCSACCPPCATRWRSGRAAAPRRGPVEPGLRPRLRASASGAPAARIPAARPRPASGASWSRALTQAVGRGLDTPRARRGVRRPRARLRHVPHLRRQLAVRAARRRRRRVRAVRPRQRRARASATHVLASRPGSPGVFHVFMSHRTGTTSWASRSSCRPTSRATRIAHLRLPRGAGGGDPPPARRPVVPGGLGAAGAARSSSCGWSPAEPTTSPASG